MQVQRCCLADITAVVVASADAPPLRRPSSSLAILGRFQVIADPYFRRTGVLSEPPIVKGLATRLGSGFSKEWVHERLQLLRAATSTWYKTNHNNEDAGWSMEDILANPWMVRHSLLPMPRA